MKGIVRVALSAVEGATDVIAGLTVLDTAEEASAVDRGKVSDADVAEVVAAASVTLAVVVAGETEAAVSRGDQSIRAIRADIDG